MEAARGSRRSLDKHWSKVGCKSGKEEARLGVAAEECPLRGGAYQVGLADVLAGGVD
jgi:hypothetical protein